MDSKNHVAMAGVPDLMAHYKANREKAKKQAEVAKTQQPPIGARAKTTDEPKTSKILYFSLDKDLETIIKVFDQPKQVRDICKILLRSTEEMTEAALIEAMDDGGIKTRQNTNRILAYYLKALTHEVGVKIETR